MTQSEFYDGEQQVATEWLIPETLPALVWGRLRVFDDGSADACFAEGVDGLRVRLARAGGHPPHHG